LGWPQVSFSFHFGVYCFSKLSMFRGCNVVGLSSVWFSRHFLVLRSFFLNNFTPFSNWFLIQCFFENCFWNKCLENGKLKTVGACLPFSVLHSVLCLYRAPLLSLPVCFLSRICSQFMYSYLCVSEFQDIFDVDHFITSLRDEVRILKELPPRLKTRVEKGLLYTMPPISWSDISYYKNQVSLNNP